MGQPIHRARDGPPPGTTTRGAHKGGPHPTEDPGPIEGEKEEKDPGGEEKGSKTE